MVLVRPQLWVVPGSHLQWRLAPWPGRARSDEPGPQEGSALTEGAFPAISEWLPDAVPVTMKPGDIMIVDRSSLHGSYPNRSDSRRLTFIMSFHSRVRTLALPSSSLTMQSRRNMVQASAVGTETQNVHAFKNGGAKFVRYTAEDVALRARMIPLAIDARRQRFPEEGRVFEYEGEFIGDARWSDKTRAEIGAPPSAHSACVWPVYGCWTWHLI